MSKEAMKLALEALDHNLLFTSLMPGYDGRIIEKAYKAINKALAEQPAQDDPDLQDKDPELVEQPAQQQEPVALQWQQSPIRTAWGDDMVVASVAIDNDHTLSLYCERDQTPKVDAMFAQRTWVGLTDEEKRQIFEREDYQGWLDYINAIEAKLRSKNEDRN